jgi:DNA-binding transcriptional LysR family regulator
VLRPTQAGEAAVAHAVQVEEQVQSLEHGIAGTDAAPAGLVRITAVSILVNRLLIPALPDFHARHPAIRVELIAEGRNMSLSRRETDIALRLSRPEGGGPALAKRIGRLDYAVYGPRRCSAERLKWITYEEGSSHLPQARWIAANAGASEIAPLLVNDAEAIIQAIRAGLGKSLLPCRIADRDDGLQRLDRSEVVLSREVWLLTHRELRHHARVAAVIAWLTELIARR